MGGMARRAHLLRPRLRRPGAVAIEIGDSVPFDRISPLPPDLRDAESDLALSLLSATGVTANVVGFAEIGYGAELLRARAARLPPGFRLLSANLIDPPPGIQPALPLAGPDPPVLLAGLVDPAAYHLGRPVEFEDAIAGVPLEDPVEALRRLRERRPEATLLAAGPISPSMFLRIRSAIPSLALVVTDDYFRFDRDPRFRFERERGTGFASSGLLGETLLVVLRSDSYALVRVGLALDQAGRILGAELEDLPLHDGVGEDPGVRGRLDAYYAGRETGAERGARAPIGRRLRDRLDAGYVGGRVCEACHFGEAAQWKGTRHASAFATLLERRRQAAPGCVPCHVTGHSLPGGYARIADLAMRHVQCEACHGPGGRHVAAPSRTSIVRTPAAADCRECHDPEHSEMTDANFGRYWDAVVHRQKAGSESAAGPGGGGPLSGDRR